MRLSFGQEQKLEQRQVLTQRMIQSMEILQMPLQKLEERLEQELQENPILEMLEEEPDDDAHETQDEEEFTPSNIEHEEEIQLGEEYTQREDFQIAEEFASNYDDTINEQPTRSQNWLEDQMSRYHDEMANVPMPTQSLHEYLIDQLSWFDISAELREMMVRLIYSLDSNGYLPSSLSDILGMNASEEEKQLGKEALLLIRQLDPAGVGARNLRECLLLQLKPDMPFYDAMRTIISGHLEDLTHNRLPLISKKTGFSIAMIQETLEQIKHLKPRPGAIFNDQSAPSVTPDIVVDTDEEGNYVVRVDDGRIPRLHISNYYRGLMKQQETNKETREYIKQKVGSAQWLIDSIMQRKLTLTKVAQAIVDHQTDFLENGPSAIKPLKMQQIAEKVGVHVTTISRAVDEKWIQTPQGNFPLKRFFSGSIASSDGEEEVAQDAVRLKLQEIIDQEDKTKPLNDEELVKALDAAGIKVARRTVVKYRQAMHIPNSRERKVWND
ncbi:MAG: RNA polymerase factor sigma-54 [Planctomycetaceae bacterium]|nr:RNA polymerase factor sigma-54 [Planctomycetaceae bacterium]